MKPRSPDARLLEEEYFARLRTALANHPAADAGDILESLHQHLEDAAADLPETEITAPQMQSLLDRLGTPESILSQEPPAPSTSATAPNIPPVAPPTSTPLTATDPGPGLQPLGNILTEAFHVYCQNFLILLLAAVLYDLLSLFTLFILGGALTAGFFSMILIALRRPDRRVDLGHLFSRFSRFFPLLGLFVIQAIGTSLGLAICIVPGILLAAIWLFAELIFIEQGTGVFDSLAASYDLAKRNFGLCCIVALLDTIPFLLAGAIPHVGFIVDWLITPFFFLISTLTYLNIRGEARVPTAAIPAGPAQVSPPPAPGVL